MRKPTEFTYRGYDIVIREDLLGYNIQASSEDGFFRVEVDLEHLYNKCPIEHAKFCVDSRSDVCF